MSTPSSSALQISRLTVPNLTLSLISLLTSWGFFFTLPLTVIGACLSLAAAVTVGIGVPVSTDPTVTSGDKVLRSLQSSNCCCGGTPANHAKSLFIAAAVFTALGFAFNALGAGLWLPCSRDWGTYYYDDDDFYYGGDEGRWGAEWEEYCR